MTQTVSDAELALLIASLTGTLTPTPTPPPGPPPPPPPPSPTAAPERTLGPWIAAAYEGRCAGCGTRIDLFDRIRSDGTGGWLAACCGGIEDDTPKAAADPLAGLIAATVPAAPVVAATPAGPPASTIGELRQVLMDFEASRPRTMQVALGPSELGTPCQQQIARKLASAPRQPITAPTWAPFQGTAVHASMEKVVEFWNRQLGRERWLAEDRLLVDPGMPAAGIDPVEGNGDAFDTDHDMVVDWKHTGKTALDKLRRGIKMGKPAAEQVSAEYRVQAHLYGLGHALKGRPVRWVRLVLLARSHDYDESQEWTEAYDENIAFEAIARYYATHDLLDAVGGRQPGDLIAVVPATPARDTCKWCPFLKPGLAAPTWEGCPGDRTLAKVVENATAGLIAPATK